MKAKNRRALGLKIARCGAVLAAIALTVLRLPRSGSRRCWNRFSREETDATGLS